MGDGSGQLTPAAWIQQASGQKGTTIKTSKVDSFQLLTSERIADMGIWARKCGKNLTRGKRKNWTTQNSRTWSCDQRFLTVNNLRVLNSTSCIPRVDHQLGFAHDAIIVVVA